MRPTVVALSVTAELVRFGWIPGPGASPQDTAQVAVDGGPWTAQSANGSLDVAARCNEVHTITVRIRRGAVVGPAATASATTPACAPRVGVVQGGPNPAGSGTCPPGACSYVIAQLRDDVPMSVHTVTCGFPEIPGPYPGVTAKRVTVDANGDADVNTNCWIGTGTVAIYVDGDISGVFTVNWRR